MTNEKILQRIDRQDQRELDKEMKTLARERKIYKERLMKKLNIPIADSYAYRIADLQSIDELQTKLENC